MSVRLRYVFHEVNEGQMFIFGPDMYVQYVFAVVKIVRFFFDLLKTIGYKFNSTSCKVSNSTV